MGADRRGLDAAHHAAGGVGVEVFRRAARPATFRAGVEVVAMDGFTGFKTATTEELPDATAVMDPFHADQATGRAMMITSRTTTALAVKPREWTQIDHHSPL